MSLADMTITPVAEAKPAPTSKPSGGTSFVRGPSAPAGAMTLDGGKFSSVDGGPEQIVRRDGGQAQALPSTEILKKFGATWAQDPAAAPATDDAPAKPVENAPATGQPAAAPAPTTDPAKPAEPAKPTEQPAPADDYRALFGERKAAEVKAEYDRLLEANRRLAVAAEAARKPASAPADDGPDYIDDSIGWIRRGVMRALGHTDPEHPEVKSEMAGLILDLNAKEFGATLDDAQQAKRDAAKARQALARDTRTRKAQGESSTSSEEAQAKQATAFIGNRLSATRSAPDGKALPSMREQLPLAGAAAQKLGLPLEEMVYRTYLAELNTGRLDPQRLNDDDYLISEAGKILESHYQDLADTLGKARPTQSTATPQPTPATAPAPAASASTGQPQGHGGRTALTAADSSQPPPTPPTPPAPKPTKKLQSREEFFGKWYPKS